MDKEKIKKVEREFINALKSLGAYLSIFVLIAGGFFIGLLKYDL